MPARSEPPAPSAVSPSAVSPSDRAARKRFAGRRQRTGSQSLLLTDPTNVRYLTGFTGDSTALLLWSERRTRRAVLVSDGRYETQLQEQCPGVEAVIRPTGQKMSDALAAQIAATGQTFHVEWDRVTVNVYRELSEAIAACDKVGRSGLVSPTEAATAETFSVSTMRRVKDAEEVAAIRRAVRASEQTFAYMRSRLRPDISEFELAADGEHVARQFGMRGWSFPAIVAAGDRAALPHYEPGDGSMGDDSHVLIDWGVREPGGYVSDMTRVLLRRKTPKKIETIYRAVHQAYEAAVAAIRPGVSAGDVDAVARDTLDDLGFGKRFSHSLGHGIGLNVHEGPGLRPGSDDELAAGMVVTVEPGVYLPGYGGVRLENDVLVTDDGVESLSTLPLDLEANRLDW